MRHPINVGNILIVLLMITITELKLKSDVFCIVSLYCVDFNLMNISCSNEGKYGGFDNIKSLYSNHIIPELHAPE